MKKILKVWETENELPQSEMAISFKDEGIASAMLNGAQNAAQVLQDGRYILHSPMFSAELFALKDEETGETDLSNLASDGLGESYGGADIRYCVDFEVKDNFIKEYEIRVEVVDGSTVHGETDDVAFVFGLKKRS